MSTPATSRIVLGTAGHIDHGKTSLVRALTGTDTDRLKEEKARGITIELGFATLELPGGERLSIVDVPGHEKFVRNMVAGAAGIDMVLFVVAADEGVMLQTREHLEICTLLGVKTGLIALTKIDMVDEEMIELARDDVAGLVEGTFLEDAPILPVSSTTNEGVEALQDELAALARTVSQRDAKGLFRLPVDRVFTMKGFGTVVTGTMASGSVRKEDEIEILPGGLRAKVRGVQVHGELVDKGYAGNRTALNFTGVAVDEINRGDIVVHPDSLSTTHMIDARLELLASCTKPLEDRGRYRLHLGTRDVPVVVALLEGETLEPGAATVVQMRSQEPFVACPGDRFVLRDYSPARTVGGGVVLDQSPVRHKGRKPEVVDALRILDSGEPGERLAVYLQLRGGEGMTPPQTQATLSVTLEEARKLLQAAVRAGHGLVADRKAQRHIDSGFVAGMEKRALEILEAFHGEHPLKKGLGVGELRSKFPDYLAPRLVEFTLERLAESGRVVLDGETVRKSDFQVRLSHADDELRNRILDVVRGRGYEAPTVVEAAELLGEDATALRPVFDYLVSEGYLARTKEGMFFDAGMIAELVVKIIDHLAAKDELVVADLKAMVGTSRKYLIPLLEYLDGQKVTRRNGDVRVAGPKGKP